MTAVPSGRLLGILSILLLPVLPADAGSWVARHGLSLRDAGFAGPSETESPGAIVVVDGPRGPEEDWEADAGSCVLRTVFDQIDGIEHAGTGAWLEWETSVDRSARRPGGRSDWGASLSDWHHAVAVWLVRSGRQEGVLLESGGAYTDLLPLDVSQVRRYRLVADETGAQLSVDGRPMLTLPLAPRRDGGPPVVRIGAGPGDARAALFAVDHGCLRPVDALLSAQRRGPATVTLLGHASLRPALAILPGSLRLEGLEVDTGSLREVDDDGDGSLDLLFELPPGVVATPGSVLHLDALTEEGQHLRGWVEVPGPSLSAERARPNRR